MAKKFRRLLWTAPKIFDEKKDYPCRVLRKVAEWSVEQIVMYLYREDRRSCNDSNPRANV